MNWKLASLSFSVSLASIATSIPNVALPIISREFSASVSAVQWVVISYLLAITVLIVGVGRVGDQMGGRRVFLAGNFCYSFGALICGIAPTLLVLIMGRALQGLGAAALTALSVALISEAVSEMKSGRAMGLIGTMSAVGTAFGPSLGGILISVSGWRSIFLMMSVLGIFNFIFAYRFLPIPADKPNVNQGFNCLGSIFPGGRLADFKKFRNSPFIPNLAMNTIVSTVMMSTLIVGPFFLSRALQLNAARVGLVMSIGPIISAISGIPAGRLVDRIGVLTVIRFGLFQMITGLIALSTLPSYLGLGGFMGSVAVLSPGYQLFQAANNAAVMSAVPSGQRGVASGLLSLSRNIGLITGASLMGTLFAFSTGSAQITQALPAAIASGMRITFCFAATLIAVAIWMAYTIQTIDSPEIDLNL